MAGVFPSDEIAATAELWLTTDDPQYKKRLYALLPQIRSDAARAGGPQRGMDARAAVAQDFRSRIPQALVVEIAKKWRAAADAVEASNPYGVRFPAFALRSDWKLDSPEQARGNSIMGFAWDLQSDAMRDYFLHKNLPEIFGADTLLNVVNFVLGCHPASNASYVSGVGANSQLIAYGFNRDDYTYIPGGPIPGASFHASRVHGPEETSRITTTRRNT